MTTCEPAAIGDGICNQECLSLEFFFDLGDCCDLNNSTCFKFMIGDGTCDASCNVDVCAFDGGDCIDLDICPEENCDLVNNICRVATEDKCNINLIGDGFCDTACDNEECLNDNGDCVKDAGFYLIRIPLLFLGTLSLLVLVFILAFSVIERLSHGSAQARQDVDDFDVDTPGRSPMEGSDLNNFMIEGSTRHQQQVIQGSSRVVNGNQATDKNLSAKKSSERPLLNNPNSNWGDNTSSTKDAVLVTQRQSKRNRAKSGFEEVSVGEATQERLTDDGNSKISDKDL